MFTKFANSWALTKQSWSVLRADKHLMIFPLLSGLLTVLVCVSFFVPVIVIVGPMLAASGAGASSAGAGAGSQSVDPALRAAGLAVMFVLYFVINVIVTFFNASLIACATARFNGEDSSATAGMKAALRRWPQILGWAAVNATVGVVLQALKERAGWIGRLLLGLAGTAWNIATFFVVPALVMDGIGPIAAVKKSFEVMKKTWGESLVTQVGVGAVMGLITMLTLFGSIAVGVALSVVTQSPWPAVVIIGVGVIASLLVALVGSTLKMILVAACYRMATTGLVPEGFEGGTLRGMFGQKR